MQTFKSPLSSAALAAIVGAGLLFATAPASAYITCNSDGDCRHTDSPLVKTGGFFISRESAKQIFIAQFAYGDETLARRGAVAITAAMMGAVYVGPDQDSEGAETG